MVVSRKNRNRAIGVVASLLLGLFVVVSQPAPAMADTFSSPGFTTEVVATVNPYTLVGAAFASDGRMFVWTKAGQVRIIKNGSLLPTPFLDLTGKVNTYDDRGLWGLTFDPDFVTNGYVYLTYVYENTNNPNDPGAKTSRLVRVTVNPANPDVALPGSETVILGSVGTAPCAPGADCIPADGSSHTIGALQFAPDGKLFLGNGDADDANQADPNALGAQDLNSYRGKILRINKDGTAPTDNPFYDGTNSVKSKVYLYGVRNPFRFALQPGTNHIWFGDVGWYTWEEINDGVPGANYGWPCYEGNDAQPSFQQLYAQCRALPASAVTAPYHTYNHTVGTAAIGGPFYTGSLYPAQYQNSFFFADYSGNFIKRVVFDANHNPLGVQPFATNVEAPVSLVVGPDSMIYYLSFTTGQIRRIRFNGPSASASATPQYGYSPLQVAFSSAGSVDAGGATLTYLWDFGDGTTSTAANPTHTYTASGVQTFTAKLTVTGSAGLTSQATTTVTVGSTPPVPTISAPVNNTVVQPGQTVNFAGSAIDPDQGPLPASALSWTVLLHHDTHVHTLIGGTGATGSFVVEDHGPIGTFSYEVILTATDSSGLRSSTSVLLPVGRDTSPPTAPGNLTAAVNGTQATLNWAASTDDVLVSGYRLERCTGVGCTDFTQIATPTATTFTDTGLSPSTTYLYRVAATDPSSNVSAYSNIATATTSSAPTQPTGLIAGYTFDAGSGSTVTDSSGNANTGTVTGATWVAGKYGGALKFNGTSDMVRVPASATLNPSAGLTLAAWIQPTVAQQGWRTIMQKEAEAWFLNASNASGAMKPSGGVTSGSDTVVYGTTANPVNQWTHVAMTYDGANLRLYVNGALVATKAKTGTVQQTANPLSIGGNAPYGEYFAGLIDEARVYNRALTAAEIQTIMNSPVVPPVADTTPPSTVASLTATATGPSQVNLTWPAASDNVDVAGYQVERCQGAGCTNFASVGTVAATSFTDTGLSAATAFSYRVRATDAAGNLGGWSPTATATTSAAADTTPPSTPANLTAAAAGTTQVNLTWSGSTDDVGVAEYRIERCSGTSCTNFVQVATATTPTYANTGLTSGTTYRFRVRAADAAGNLSGYSTIATATTTTADTTAPSAPSGLSATAVSPTQVDLAWTASTDNVGVSGYRVERCTGASCTNYAEVAQPAGTTWSDTGRTQGTVYRYRVRAADAAGNLSAYSSVVSATTPALPDSTPPSTPASLTATPNGTQIGLAWPASTDNVSVAGYRVQRCTGSGCTDFAQVATPTTNAYTDAGLAPNTTYLYQVAAIDPSGNVSGWSPTATATTSSAPTQPTGLIAGYTFDAGSGSTVTDSSGNANTGTITGATWVAGKYGGALKFNGTSDMVRVPASATLSPSTGITMAAWIQPTASQQGWRTIMQKEAEAWFLNASNATSAMKPSGGVTSGSDTVVYGTTANPVNQWTHIALTYDGANLRLYVNGTQVATKAKTGAIQQTTNPLSIGGNAPYGEYFAGLIDEARVYNRALTAAEIQTIMSTPLS